MGEKKHLELLHCPAAVFFVTQIARACGDRSRALLFRGWSRLCLHAASLSAAEAFAAATAVARANRAEAMEKKAKETADTRETAAARPDGNSEEGVDEATAATSAALERAERAEGALQVQGGQLVRMVAAASAMPFSTQNTRLQCSFP